MPSTALSRIQLPAQSRVTTRLPDFIALMKPRVMLLAVFTALVGLTIAPGHLDPVLECLAVLAIAAGAGAAGVLNMWYDADIDAVMRSHGHASNPSWRDLTRRSACVRAFSRLQRSRRSCCRDQCQGCSTARLHDLLLRRCVHDLAEAAHATKHRHWRCRRRASAGDRLDRRYRRDWARAAHSLLDHLPVDAAPFLGAVAQSYATNMAAPAFPCSRSLPEEPQRPGRLSSIAFFWCRYRCCPGRWDLPAHCTARRPSSAARFSSRWLCGCTGAGQPNRQAAHRLFVFSISYLFLLFAALLINSSGDRWSSIILDARCSGCRRTSTSRNPAATRSNRIPFHHGQGKRGLTCATA